MFYSNTYGELELTEIPNKLLKFYNDHKIYESDFQIIVGTDSQNFDVTKIVSVITIICKGHGGIYFYRITKENKINDIRTKLHRETNLSLEITTELVKLLEENDIYNDMYINVPVSIHIDAGNSNRSRTKELIPELVGWINAMGYECKIKPESFAASSIADKISK